MHPNAQTLQRFYAAFAQLDHATMAACYAPNATFDDEAFSLKGREQIGGMWRMLCTATQKPGAAAHWKLAFSGIEADANGGKAHWEADYLFSATGRKVHNNRRRHIYFHAGRADCHPPRPLQLLELVPPGAGAARRVAGMVAVAQAQGAEYGGGEFEAVFGVGVRGGAAVRQAAQRIWNCGYRPGADGQLYRLGDRFRLIAEVHQRPLCGGTAPGRDPKGLRTVPPPP